MKINSRKQLPDEVKPYEPHYEHLIETKTDYGTSRTYVTDSNPSKDPLHGLKPSDFDLDKLLKNGVKLDRVFMSPSSKLALADALLARLSSAPDIETIARNANADNVKVSTPSTDPTSSTDPTLSNF